MSQIEYDGFSPATFDDAEIVKKLDSDFDRAIKTGVNLIDDVFGALLPSDVVLLGAKTGLGKSSLSTIIAQNATAQGKRVSVYALEDEYKEVEMRMIFAEMAYLNTQLGIDRRIDDLNYKFWRINRKYYGDVGESLRHRAVENLKNRNNNLNIYYRKGDFKINTFIKTAMAQQNKTDLIIIDHIHYFDIDTSSNREIGEAIKAIRDIALLTNIPIILIAHLRKETQEAGKVKIVPTLDDFYGSSDLSKICTKGMILASGGFCEDNKAFRTLFTFPKFRIESQSKKYIFIGYFDAYKKIYLPQYDIIEFRTNDKKLVTQIKQKEFINPKSLGWLGQP